MAADFLIKLDVRRQDDHLSAVSEDVHGLHVCGDSAEAVHQRAMAAIKALYKFNSQMDVEVTATDDQTVLRVRLL